MPSKESRVVIAQSDKRWGDRKPEMHLRVVIIYNFLRGSHASLFFALWLFAIWRGITAGDGSHTACYTDHSGVGALCCQRQARNYGS
jgi:hypothetical protein